MADMIKLNYLANYTTSKVVESYCPNRKTHQHAHKRMHYLDHDVVGKDFIDVSVAQSKGQELHFLYRKPEESSTTNHTTVVFYLHHLKEGYLLPFTSDYTPS